jgi:hypothetical protein
LSPVCGRRQHLPTRPFNNCGMVKKMAIASKENKASIAAEKFALNKI